MNLRALLFLLAFVGLGKAYYSYDAWRPDFSKSTGAQPVSTTPDQKPLTVPKTFGYKGYQVTKVASYSMTARVLSHERYYLDRESDLSPIDLALGWGLMTNKKVLSQILVSQGGRFYSWYADEYPIPPEQIISSSANTHIIPATKAVEKTVKSLRTGQFVSLSGYLVNVAGTDGWYWNTSLSRDDTGMGACEIFYVETAYIP